MAIYIYLPEVSGIYQILNLVNQKRYIGYASNIRQRLKGHVSDLYHSKHPNDHLQKVWLKYGIHSFSFSVLQECSKDKMCFYEDYWVRILKATEDYYGYNIRPTDPNGIPGHSQETIEKLKNANTGRSRYGKDNHFFGHKISEDHKEKMRKSRENIDYKALHREKRGKKVINIITGEIYSSVAEVSDIIGMSKGSLSRILLGKRNNNTNFKYA